MTFFSFILFFTKKKNCCFSSLHFVWIDFRRFLSESHVSVCVLVHWWLLRFWQVSNHIFVDVHNKQNMNDEKKAHTRWAIALFVDDVRTTLFSGRTEIERKKNTEYISSIKAWIKCNVHRFAWIYRHYYRHISIYMLLSNRAVEIKMKKKHTNTQWTTHTEKTNNEYCKCQLTRKKIRYIKWCLEQKSNWIYC